MRLRFCRNGLFGLSKITTPRPRLFVFYPLRGSRNEDHWLGSVSGLAYVVPDGNVWLNGMVSSPQSPCGGRGWVHCRECGAWTGEPGGRCRWCYRRSDDHRGREEVRYNWVEGATAFMLGLMGTLFFLQLLAAANNGQDMPAHFDEPVRPTVH
jgi:hypothetical protein